MNTTRRSLSRWAVLGTSVGLGAIALVFLLSSRGSTIPEADSTGLAARYDALPLSFEHNQGQADPRVRYYARGLGYGLFLTDDQMILNLCGQDARIEAGCTAVRAKLLDASTSARAQGEERLPGSSSYFIGNDRSKWQTGIARYGKVRYREVYTGIDLVLYGNQRRLEYDFVVAPGADPDLIRVSYSGANALRLDRQGHLHIELPAGELIQHKPVIYQTVGSQRKYIEGRFELTHRDESTEVAFIVGQYDRSRPLVIDPVLRYSTFLGGNGPDSATAIAVDATGNAYVTGLTDSTDFPGGEYPETSVPPDRNVFVAKLTADGSGLAYSTYLGGSNLDVPTDIAVDSSGNAYIVGNTDSTNFPTASPLQATNAGAVGFITKLSADGNTLVYSTYYGGSSIDSVSAIAVDTAGNAYVAGSTRSDDFPLASPLQPLRGGNTTGFVSKIDSSGGALVYSTYFGGSQDATGAPSEDILADIAVDATGSAYVAGVTRAIDLPTVNAFQPAHGGGRRDAFAAKLDSTGGALIYSTYLGGSGDDRASALAVSDGGNAYIVGITDSSDFPTANPLQGTKPGMNTSYATKLTNDGRGLVYSTYLGGGTDLFEVATDVAVDTSGNAYVSGWTFSPDFPTINALQPIKPASTLISDAFIAGLAYDGDAFLFSTYFGGCRNEQANGIAVDATGNVYLAGETFSLNFPTAFPFQVTKDESRSGFVTKIDPAASGSSLVVSCDSDGGDGSGGGGASGGGGGAFGWVSLAALLALLASYAATGSTRIGLPFSTASIRPHRNLGSIPPKPRPPDREFFSGFD